MASQRDVRRIAMALPGVREAPDHFAELGGESRMATISAVLRDEPKPLSEIRAGMPRELERIIARCLRKDPSRRFQHMEDLRVALEEVKEESGDARWDVRGVPPVADRAPRWVWLAAALTVAGLSAVLIWRFSGLGGNRLLPGLVDTVQVTTTPGLAPRAARTCSSPVPCASRPCAGAAT